MKMGDKWTVTRSHLFTVESDTHALFVVRLLKNPNKPSVNNYNLLQNVVSSYIAFSSWTFTSPSTPEMKQSLSGLLDLAHE